jgi:hypothetical protein
MQVGTALAHKVPGGVGHRRRMYEMFDRQRRGAIGLEEFRTGCFELGLRLSPVEALAVFGFCDARVDGLVNYSGKDQMQRIVRMQRPCPPCFSGQGGYVTRLCVCKGLHIHIALNIS